MPKLTLVIQTFCDPHIQDSKIPRCSRTDFIIKGPFFSLTAFSTVPQIDVPLPFQV